MEMKMNNRVSNKDIKILMDEDFSWDTFYVDYKNKQKRCGQNDRKSNKIKK